MIREISITNQISFRAEYMFFSNEFALFVNKPYKLILKKIKFKRQYKNKIPLRNSHGNLYPYHGISETLIPECIWKNPIKVQPPALLSIE